MRILLDTQIILGLLRGELQKKQPRLARRLSDPAAAVFVSVGSLWEIAIKTRLGKLDPGMKLEDIAGYVEAMGAALLPIEAPHVNAAAEPEPDTRDSFDRLLLAQCHVEKLALATIDRALVAHPLAFKF